MRWNEEKENECVPLMGKWGCVMGLQERKVLVSSVNTGLHLCCSRNLHLMSHEARCLSLRFIDGCVKLKGRNRWSSGVCQTRACVSAWVLTVMWRGLTTDCHIVFSVMLSNGWSSVFMKCFTEIWWHFWEPTHPQKAVKLKPLDCFF